MSAERKRLAPYAPASVVSEFFDHIRYVRTPDKVDNGLLQDYGFSEGQAFPLMSTLKFLGIIDTGGTPTAGFRALQTGGDEFQAALNEMMQRAYSDLFSRLDITRDSKDKIKNFFARNYSPATAERATALFLDLCGEAGIDAAAAKESKRPPLGEKKKPASQRASLYLPPRSPPPDGAHVVVEIRLTEDDLRIMDAQDIEAVFAAAAKIEVARTKAYARKPEVKADTSEEAAIQ